MQAVVEFPAGMQSEFYDKIKKIFGTTDSAKEKKDLPNEDQIQMLYYDLVDSGCNIDPKMQFNLGFKKIFKKQK